MGSLTSRPELPQVQQPVIISGPSPSVFAPPPTSAGAAPEPADEQATQKAREESLLQRSRGRIGTVLTGFNGILSQTVTPARKTLLGE